jgi:hypothetical protein
MIKIINKGLNEFGLTEIAKHFDYEFKVGQIVGNKSKTIKSFDPNTDMGKIRFCETRVPLSWLNYELFEVTVTRIKQ